MRRARHPLPMELKGLVYDPNSKKYVVSEKGVCYFLTIEHTRMLKESYKKDNSIEKWYYSLDKLTKKEIFVVNKNETDSSDFYPDKEYDVT